VFFRFGEQAKVQLKDKESRVSIVESVFPFPPLGRIDRTQISHAARFQHDSPQIPITEITINRRRNVTNQTTIIYYFPPQRNGELK
jgi:hypothetical protein